MQIEFVKQKNIKYSKLICVLNSESIANSQKKSDLVNSRKRWNIQSEVKNQVVNL